MYTCRLKSALLADLDLNPDPDPEPDPDTVVSSLFCLRNMQLLIHIFLEFILAG